ncbi:MAG: hypothetical protein DRI71_04020 [Bacteroidetes bacterium]|nr:MAG: hypothetical protein DRI71_04020 [Bacteroidota bacterium]
MKKLLIALWYVSVPVLLFAQKAPVKFGKIDDATVEMTSHPLDTTASAIVLMDYGNTTFRYLDNEGFIFDFTRIIRIKIFTKDGLEHGDFDFSYYNSGVSDEKITAIKGFSYNLVDGQVEKTKLNKSSIFKEEESEHWDNIRISMPDVREGTVIELTYKLTSPFKWNLQTWEFQSEIPTLYSEYKVAIPEYFDYQLLMSGYHRLLVNEKKTTSGSISIQSKSRTGGGASGGSTTKTTFDTQKFDFRNFNYRWVAKDVPAFKVESFVASPSDYLSKIEFELRGTQYPNSVYEQYMGSWSSLNKSFLKNSKFGEALKSVGSMKAELESISTLDSENEKIAGLVNLVRNQMEWNGRNTRYVNTTLKKAWNDKKGATADINLAIVAGLRRLGFKSDPVLISTRAHGMIRDQYAMSSQFNSVIACVELGDKLLLLDGTDRFLPIGVLPKQDLNGKGWRVSESAPGWIKLTTSTKQEQTLAADFKLSATGELTGTIEQTSKGYAGYAAHKNLKMKGEDEYFKAVQEKNEGWLIEDHEYNSEASNSEPFISKYKIEMNENLTLAADRIYFNPTLNEIMSENPFKVEKREYPVDYGFPLSNSFSFNFTLPEGYEIEETPESVSFSLAGKSGSFSYDIKKEGATSFKLVAEFSIDKTMFAQTEYAELKEFYHKVVQKCSEQVVIKKSGQ